MYRLAIAFVFAAVLLTGCGTSSGSWQLDTKGDAWDRLQSADSLTVAPVKIGARGEKEVRPADWATAWPGDFADRTVDSFNAAGSDVQASTKPGGKLLLKLELDPFYNGNGYSAFGSNPAYATATATFTTPDGKVVAVVKGHETLGNYQGGGPYRPLLTDLGETLAGWVSKQR